MEAGIPFETRIMILMKAARRIMACGGEGYMVFTIKKSTDSSEMLV
jgi:hypothetical protein